MKKAISKVLSLATMFMISVALMGCEPSGKAEIQPGPDVTDDDGNVYPSIKIGKQIWMAKNLNVNIEGSVCYNNDPANCEKYGRLYTWQDALTACPSGWHLPKKEEIDTLLVAMGITGASEDGFCGQRAVGLKKMDKFGFSPLPAGGYVISTDAFWGLGEETNFWAGRLFGEAFVLEIGGSGALFCPFSEFWNAGFSIRCLQDDSKK